MKEEYSSRFEETLKRMKWPGKDLTLQEGLDKEWAHGVSRLLELQESDLLEQETAERTQRPEKMPVLLPTEILVKPLELRFDYHFNSDKATNRMDKVSVQPPSIDEVADFPSPNYSYRMQSAF